MAKNDLLVAASCVTLSVCAGALATWVDGRPWPLLLVAVFVLLVAVVASQWRAKDQRVEFTALIVCVSVGLIYALGLWPRAITYLGVDPTDAVYLMAATSVIGLTAGVFVASVLRRRRPARQPVAKSPTRERVLNFIAWGAIGVAAVNYATGDIPLFASDVDAARFAGDYGVLGRFWPIVFPVLQVAMVIRLSERLRLRDLRSWGLPFACLAVFVLSGARSFILLVLLTLALSLVASGRAGLPKLALLGGGALILLGLAGSWRLALSDAGGERSGYLASRGFEGPIGSIDTSLQVGPQVLTLVLRSLPQAGFQGGEFMLRDLLYFLGQQPSGSDRWVTALLGRDPASVGGLPPTLAGGLYIDFGWAGVVAGSLLLGFVLQMALSSARIKGRPLARLAACYFGAYLIVSSYSYVSVKPSLIVALGLFWFLQRIDTKRDQHASTPRLEIPQGHGRG